MRKAIVLLVAVLILSLVTVGLVYAGWKENYREKYSKKTLDPNSEKAKKIRRLCNFEFTYAKKKTPEERKALGLEPKTTLTESLMPWKKESTDKFEGYTTNISPARKVTEGEVAEEKIKNENTLTGLIRRTGSAVKEEVDKALDVKSSDVK